MLAVDVFAFKFCWASLWYFIKLCWRSMIYIMWYFPYSKMLLSFRRLINFIQNIHFWKERIDFSISIFINQINDFYCLFFEIDWLGFFWNINAVISLPGPSFWIHYICLVEKYWLNYLIWFNWRRYHKTFRNFRWIIWGVATKLMPIMSFSNWNCLFSCNITEIIQFYGFW